MKIFANAFGTSQTSTWCAERTKSEFPGNYRHKMQDPGESQVRETNRCPAHSNNYPNLGFIIKLNSPWVKPMFFSTHLTKYFCQEFK